MDRTESDDVVLSLMIDRTHSVGGGQTTGALDSEADGDRLLVTQANVAGRLAVACTWYDAIGRPTDTVGRGTYGGSDLDRDGMSVSARSDNDLKTTTAYYDLIGEARSLSPTNLCLFLDANAKQS